MKLKNWEEKIERISSKYKTNKYRFYFQRFKTIRSFGDTYNGKINIKDVKIKQVILLKNILDSSK